MKVHLLPNASCHIHQSIVDEAALYRIVAAVEFGIGFLQGLNPCLRLLPRGSKSTLTILHREIVIDGDILIDAVLVEAYDIKALCCIVVGEQLVHQLVSGGQACDGGEKPAVAKLSLVYVIGVEAVQKEMDFITDYLSEPHDLVRGAVRLRAHRLWRPDVVCELAVSLHHGLQQVDVGLHHFRCSSPLQLVLLFFLSALLLGFSPSFPGLFL
mmetsp:Transcript_22615/g.53344  ORF Transcript_22615/g.53344 Transcript_22615/m.53344 type:complete len:212 (+) Transcript_22615:1185-1820(+)